jgi:hypothetical protein
LLSVGGGGVSEYGVVGDGFEEVLTVGGLEMYKLVIGTNFFYIGIHVYFELTA